MVVFSKTYKQLILGGTLLLFSFVLNSQNKKLVDSLRTKFNVVLYQNFEQAEKIGQSIEKLSANSTDDNIKVQAYHNLARLSLMRKDYPKATSYIDKVKAIDEDKILPKNKIRQYNYIAYLENINLNYDVSIKYSERAFNLALEINDSLKVGESLINQAKFFIGQQDLKKGRENLEKSLLYLKGSKHSKAIEDAYFSYGRTYYLRDIDSALFYYNKSLASAKTTQNLYRQSEIYCDIAVAYIFNGKPENAKEFLDQSLELSQQVQHNSLLHNIFYTYGLHYELTEKYELAVKNYKKAINDYSTFVNPVQLSNAQLMLSSAMYHNNDFQLAYDYLLEHVGLKDSIFNVRKSKEFENIRTTFEVERKDNRITLLEKDNELAATRRNWIISSSVLVAAILASLFLFYRNRAKMQFRFRTQEKDLHAKETERLKKEQKLKQIQGYIEGQEKEKNRIALELHDGIASELAGVHHLLGAMDDENKNDKLKSISQEVSRLANSVRRLSHNLSSNYTQDKSLLQLLSELKYNYEHTETFTIDITVFPPEDFNKISSNVKHQLYRIIQELLKNVSKHAEANKVSISLTRYDNELSLIFEDDGKGAVKEHMTKGIGLKNIRERVSGLEGTFHLETSQQSGTNIIIQIPYQDDQDSIGPSR